METVTVVVPMYNASGYVHRLVGTFEKQSSRMFTVLFVNDASTDNTLAFLNKAVENATFSHQIIDIPLNGGTGHARNVAMQYVETKYFCFTDADDFLSEMYIEKLLCKAEETGADIVISSAEKYWGDCPNKPHYNIRYYMHLSDDPLALACILDDGPCGMLVKTAFWHDCRVEFPVGIRAEDLAVIPLLYTEANKIEFAPDAVYYYVQTSNSRSRMGGGYFDDIYQSFLIMNDRLNNQVICEFKAAVNIGYGVIVNAIVHGESRSVVRRYVTYLNENFPKGYRNQYIRYLPWPKRVYIILAYRKLYTMLKVLTAIGKKIW
jgi:glycosyltransferase involved in cell wall biosynthesis